MLDWIKTEDKLPEKKGDMCLIYSDKTGGIAGPIGWFDDKMGWLDLFATPEAGSSFRPEIVSHWALFNYPDGEQD